MTTPKIAIHNAETGEIEIREFTVEELAEAEAEKAAKVTEESKVLADKTALLEKLGITEDEARLLLG